MKFLLLIFFCLIMTRAVKAQVNTSESLKLYQHNFHPKDKKITFQYYDTLMNLRIYDNSVLKIPEPLLAYKGNINGFAIYQSTPDNMYVVKPDSTIAFNMPVKKLITGLNDQ